MEKTSSNIGNIFSNAHSTVKNGALAAWSVFESRIVRAWATVFWHGVVYLFSLFMVVRWSSMAKDIFTRLEQPGEIGLIDNLIRTLKGDLKLKVGEDTEIVLVIAISFLWFFTFLTANSLRFALSLSWRAAHNENQEGHPSLIESISSYMLRKLFIFISIISAVAVFVSFKEMPEPAIFVMALIAIFIAAEHYGGLRESENKLEEKTNEITGKIGKVLNADGMAEWRVELYGLYGKSISRVDAVIRYFEIDGEWWRCAGKDDPWGIYDGLSKENPDSLLAALRKCEAKVQFVSDFPLPEFDGSAESSNSIKKGDFFRNFLGLAWCLVIFEMVSHGKNSTNSSGYNKKHMRVKISKAPSWMHVVDQTVYQVIERGLPENSTVRQLTHSISSENARRNLSDWARRSVRQFADRGGLAEEYVLSVFRYYGLKNLDELKISENKELEHDDYVGLLNKIGMEDFLKMTKQEFILNDLPGAKSAHGRNKSIILSRKDAENLCVAVFEKLLTDRCRKCAGVMGAAGGGAEVTLNKLLCEVV